MGKIRTLGENDFTIAPLPALMVQLYPRDNLRTEKMPFAKDWRRYNPNLQLVVKAWDKSHNTPLETTYEVAADAHRARQTFYAFLRALERAKGRDKEASALWEMARNMTFRVQMPDGKVLNFVKGYVGPAKLVICLADHDRMGDPIDQILFANKIADDPRTIHNDPEWQARMDKLMQVQEALNKKSEVVEGEKANLVALESKRGPAPVDLTDEQKEEAFKARLWNNPLVGKLFDQIYAKNPESAKKYALMQQEIFPKDGWEWREATEWLASLPKT